MMKQLLILPLLVLVACVPSVYDQPYPIQNISLPRDHAAHPAPIEWWYYTGHLQDEQGHEYGFEVTIFKAYTPPEVKLFELIPASVLAEKGHVGHVALTNKTVGTFEMAQIADFWGYKASSREDVLDVQLADWRIHLAEDGISHILKASAAGFELDLVLTPVKPVALHGLPPGIQSMGEGGVSYYLSYPRMQAVGTLKNDCSLLSCTTLPVQGEAWHDHQWGDFDMAQFAGWDWFSLQFDDHTELMLYLIRQPNGQYSEGGGSFIDAAGRTTFLQPEDFQLQSAGNVWTSPETAAIYPLSWSIQVPSFGIDVMVKPVLDFQEMDTRATTGIVYWEGAMDISGSHAGKGFMELTNYDLYPFGHTDDETPLYPFRGPLGRLSN